jgi:hypothetical protein
VQVLRVNKQNVLRSMTSQKGMKAVFQIYLKIRFYFKIKYRNAVLSRERL